jgi:hypothetical protein
MKIAIAIDDWKLQVFDRHLVNAGYKYESRPGLSENTMILTVDADSQILSPIVRAANDECAKKGRKACQKLH